MRAIDKDVEAAGVAHELGAEIDGELGKICGGTARLWKTAVCSLAVALLSKCRTPKRIQVLGGRWAFLAQFRRPLFAVFSDLWKAARPGCSLAARRRAGVELVMALWPLCYAPLRPVISGKVCTQKLWPLTRLNGVVLSACPRGWVDLAGRIAPYFKREKSRWSQTFWLSLCLMALVGLSELMTCWASIPWDWWQWSATSQPTEWHSERGHDALWWKDVNIVEKAMVLNWLMLHPMVSEVHVWGGSPCVHLSSARAGRKNLAGPGSNLFWKLVDVIQMVQQTFSAVASVKWVVEKVASMDPEARDEISSVLEVVPLRLDPADVLPYSRPRFAWISEQPAVTEGCELVQRKGFVEVTMTAEGVAESQWIQPGWNRVDPSCPLPTSMKSIKREQPPPVPAGLRRTPWDARNRWADDEFRFPPHQYEEHFTVTDGTLLRYVNSGEREILMSFGPQHIRFRLPASEIKKSAVRYEDARLVGDSFRMLSFGWVAGQLCRAIRQPPGPQEIVNVLGLAPGTCSRAGASAPMGRWKQRGFDVSEDSAQAAQRLVNKLALGANHTGSDVRIRAHGTIEIR